MMYVLLILWLAGALAVSLLVCDPPDCEPATLLGRGLACLCWPLVPVIVALAFLPFLIGVTGTAIRLKWFKDDIDD